MPPTNLDIIKDALYDFEKVQRHMLNAREENATKTYAGLKDEYLSLKALLTAAGVSLVSIDKINENE